MDQRITHHIYEELPPPLTLRMRFQHQIIHLVTRNIKFSQNVGQHGDLDSCLSIPFFVCLYTYVDLHMFSYQQLPFIVCLLFCLKKIIDLKSCSFYALEKSIFSES